MRVAQVLGQRAALVAKGITEGGNEEGWEHGI